MRNPLVWVTTLQEYRGNESQSCGGSRGNEISHCGKSAGLVCPTCGIVKIQFFIVSLKIPILELLAFSHHLGQCCYVVDGVVQVQSRGARSFSN